MTSFSFNFLFKHVEVEGWLVEGVSGGEFKRGVGIKRVVRARMLEGQRTVEMGSVFSLRI